MKNKMRVTVLGLILLVICFVGCSSEKKSEATAQNKEQSSSKEKDSNKVSKEETKEQPEVDSGNEEKKTDASEGDDKDSELSDNKLQSMEEIAAMGQKDVDIYCSNDNSDGLKKATITIAQLTPEGLLSELVNKGVVTGDIQIVSCKEVMVDKSKALDLDLSKSFETYLNSMGTAGERVTIQSVCNTYLNAFGCEKIRLTVEGQSLATGHAEYPGYLEFFE